MITPLRGSDFDLSYRCIIDNFDSGIIDHFCPHGNTCSECIQEMNDSYIFGKIKHQCSIFHCCIATAHNNHTFIFIKGTITYCTCSDSFTPVFGLTRAVQSFGRCTCSIMTACAVSFLSLSVISTNGDCLKSTLLIDSSRKLVPKWAACSCICIISCGPKILFSPGQFSIKVVPTSCPPG